MPQTGWKHKITPMTPDVTVRWVDSKYWQRATNTEHRWQKCVCVCVRALQPVFTVFKWISPAFFFQQKLKTNQGEAAFHAHSLKRTHAQAGKGPSSLKSIHVYFFFVCFSSGVFKLLSFALCCRLCVGLCVYVCGGACAALPLWSVQRRARGTPLLPQSWSVSGYLMDEWDGRSMTDQLNRTRALTERRLGSVKYWLTVNGSELTARAELCASNQAGLYFLYPSILVLR